MISTNLFETTDSHRIVGNKGAFSILEYDRDISVSPEIAESAYFASLLEYRKRQLIARITDGVGIISQKGTMQIMLGDVEAVTDVDGVGDLMKKYVGSKVTKEPAIKPRYTGSGTVILEPTFRYIILESIEDWGGGLVIDDGLFLACEDTVEMSVTARSNISSAAFGGEGLFNTSFTQKGVVALESPAPRNELIEIVLTNDTVKIDGNMAIAWSKTLDFTVTRTTPTLVGSFLAGEGLVNTYKGTGKILVAPVAKNEGISKPDNK